MLAENVVRAPNLSRPDIRGVDASHEQLKQLFVDRQLRINVGPPNASISVWITEPTKTHRSAQDGQPDVSPTTLPATTRPVHRGTLFLLHGIVDQKEMPHYLKYRDALIADGYRVVQVDFRGHGRSTGDWITFGAVEAHDLKQVLDALQKQELVDDQVGVLGVSYGGACAIKWAAIDPRVRAVVAVEPYSSFRSVAHDAAPVALGWTKWMYSDADIDNAVALAGQYAGFNPDDASPLDAIARMHTPVLLIHSRTDGFIPWQESQALHDAAKDHSKLILLDGPNHFDFWFKGYDLIHAESVEWFKKFI